MIDKKNIFWQNSKLLVVDKPHGVLSVPSRDRSDERRILGLELEKLLGERLFPVHRLDFEVGGLIIFARDRKSHQILNDLFATAKIHKTYCALTQKPPGMLPEEGKQTWHSLLAKGKKRAYEASFGKPSTTVAYFLGMRHWQGEEVLQWHLEPVTGRSHQLRYELYKRQMPIVGDVLYGSKQTFAPQKIALRCMRLDFTSVDPAALQALALDTDVLTHEEGEF